MYVVVMTVLDSHSGAVVSCGQFVYFFFALAQTGLIAVTLLLQGFELHVQLHALPWQPWNHNEITTVLMALHGVTL